MFRHQLSAIDNTAWSTGEWVFRSIYDGQVAVMAAQLYSQGVIDLLGFTIPTGNQWRYCAPRFPITSFHWSAQMLFP
jgi:hypothetical protein